MSGKRTKALKKPWLAELEKREPGIVRGSHGQRQRAGFRQFKRGTERLPKASR